MVEGIFTTTKNRKIRQTKRAIWWETKQQMEQFLDQKLVPLSRKCPELIPEESLTNGHPLVKNLFTGKIPNLQLAGALALFQQELGKIDPRSGNWICRKGVRDTILESSSTNNYSKTSDCVQNTGIVNRSGDYMEVLDKGAIKKSNIISQTKF